MTNPRFIARPDWYDSTQPETLEATGKTLGWGVVATGGISTTVSGDIALLADAKLAAVSSRSEASAQAFAQKFNFENFYFDTDTTGYQQLIADPAVDVVYIGTPHAQHYDIARAAIEAGKHVLCEKTVTINAAEAASLINLAKAKNVFFMEAVWARFVPGIQRALKLIADGEIGDVKWVQADLGFNATPERFPRLWAPADGGGALLDLTVYPLLWAWGTLGKPDSIHATGQVTESGIDSQNSISLSYANGGQAQLMSYMTSFGQPGAFVSGTAGTIETIGSVNNPRQIRITDADGNSRVESFEFPGSGYTYQLREVTRCIQAGLTESATMPLADSLAIMELFDEVRRQLGTSYDNDTRTDLA